MKLESSLESETKQFSELLINGMIRDNVFTGNQSD
jgi:hypothetical protein